VDGVLPIYNCKRASWEGFVIKQILRSFAHHGLLWEAFYLRTGDQYQEKGAQEKHCLKGHKEIQTRETHCRKVLEAEANN